jgi:hypothetical protein
MKSCFFALFALPLLGLSCFADQKAKDNVVPVVINEKMDSLCFEANVDTLFICPVPDKYKYGIDYQNKVICHLSDSCEIVVGVDANYQLSLHEIAYFKNIFNLDTAKLLILHIHSPTKTFISSVKPKKGKRYYFKLLYRKGDNDNYRFYSLEAKNPTENLNKKK